MTTVIPLGAVLSITALKDMIDDIVSYSAEEVGTPSAHTWHRFAVESLFYSVNNKGIIVTAADNVNICFKSCPNSVLNSIFCV